MAKASFKVVDFVATWKIDEGETTPYLFAVGKFLTGFEQWLAKNGFPIDTDPADKYNGVPYLIHYAFLPITGIAFDADHKTKLTLHELNEETNDIKLMVLSTSDLTDWTEAEIRQLTVKSDGTLVFDHTADPKRFYTFAAEE